MKPVSYIASIQNQPSLQIRQYHGQYYAGWLSCEDPACGHRTARLPQTFAGGYPVCRLCEKGVMFREYTEKDLYLQINFFLYLFDLTKNNNSSKLISQTNNTKLSIIFIASYFNVDFIISEARVTPQITAAFQVLREVVEDALTHSAYSIINLSKLFRFFTLDPKAGNKIKPEPVEIDILPETEQIDALLEMGIY